MRGLNANPTALIAAEIALSQLAGEKGQWTAMRDTAAPGAEVFAPAPVNALEWLKRQENPPVATKWEPQAVWMSCDGSIGVVEGSWSQGEASGRFASVWQRQEKGEYKWLLHQDGADQAARTAPPDMLSAIVADCPARPARQAGGEQDSKRVGQAPAPVDALAGYSADKTLYWRSADDPSGQRRLLVGISKDGTMETVLGAEIEGQAER